MFEVIFPPAIQAGINSGAYQLVKTATGVLLPIAREVSSGRFVGVGRLVEKSASLAQSLIGINPLFAPAQIVTTLVTSGVQMGQIHRGFQKTYTMLESLQADVCVLQATTSLIGVGVATGVVLSAVNLHQVLQLRKDVQALRLDVNDGFFDLKQLLHLQQNEILVHLEKVVRDVEFNHHKAILARAYGQFVQALNLIKSSLRHNDLTLRNADLGNAQHILNNALADYNNPALFSNSSASGVLRRKECSWAIEQTIIMTHHLQGAYDVVEFRLGELQKKVRQDSLSIIDACQSEDELKFIFPELLRIINQDLGLLELWHDQIDWSRSLSVAEQQELVTVVEEEYPYPNELSSDLIQVSEYTTYKNLQSRSHFDSLKDQLRLFVRPELRQKYETEIRDYAVNSRYPALAPSNWQEVPDLAVTNLYWFFKDKNEVRQTV